MTTRSAEHSPAWVIFTHVSFVGSLALVLAGIALLPLDTWIKGYFVMGVALLVQSCITVTKTIRDVHESTRLVQRLEDAKTERLLMDMERSAG